MTPLFEIRKLSGGYNNKSDVIKNISLNINTGDFLGIIGPNGCGKTTLLRLVTRILHPKNGEVTFKEQNVFQMNLKEFCRNVAFVSQDPEISFAFSVREIVLMGRTPHLKRLQLETKKDLEIAEESLAATDSADLNERMFDELSAGERQRVIIARALTQEPVLLFLDEPTSHLDIGHQIQILDLLKKLNKIKNLTIAMVLHDLNLASTYCNRLILLNKGEIFKEGRPADVLTRQNIEDIYKTNILVNENPITHNPNVILISKERSR